MKSIALAYTCDFNDGTNGRQMTTDDDDDSTKLFGKII